MIWPVFCLITKLNSWVPPYNTETLDPMCRKPAVRRGAAPCHTSSSASELHPWVRGTSALKEHNSDCCYEEFLCAPVLSIFVLSPCQSLWCFIENLEIHIWMTWSDYASTWFSPYSCLHLLPDSWCHLLADDFSVPQFLQWQSRISKILIPSPLDQNFISIITFFLLI